MPSQARQKELGAYYTDPVVVRFLVNWGVNAATQRALDPSCGDGRFLVEARRIGVREVIGCDLDEQAVGIARRSVEAVPASPAAAPTTAQWVRADFFSVEPTDLEPVDLVLGNPPFIRYQRFRGETRRRALDSAAVQGARLTGLTSSWAPFVLHATRFLSPGGRLAMVVPAEIGNTQYGRPTLRALASHFAHVHLIALERNWFDDALTEAHLLLAEGYQRGAGAVTLTSVPDVHGLDAGLSAGRTVDLNRDTPLSLAFVPERQEDTFLRLLEHPAVRRIEGLGRVGNGYVTGDNEFFHRTQAEARERGWPDQWLQPAARSARSLSGLFYTSEDVVEQEAGGRAHHLILPEVDPGSSCDDHEVREGSLRSFLDEGQSLGVPRRYKCRVRDPWWRVPGATAADVLLPYMTGDRPLASVNRCGAVHTNSLHGLFLADGVDATAVAATFLSSFTLLAWEAFGRSYGGGVLKLEPTEMARLPLLMPAGFDGRELAPRLDALLREGRFADATELVDVQLLERVEGMTRGDLDQLRDARETLRRRRTSRMRR